MLNGLSVISLIFLPRRTGADGNAAAVRLLPLQRSTCVYVCFKSLFHVAFQRWDCPFFSLSAPLGVFPLSL